MGSCGGKDKVKETYFTSLFVLSLQNINFFFTFIYSVLSVLVFRTGTSLSWFRYTYAMVAYYCNENKIDLERD